MIGLDTNVLVRYAAQDDAVQSPKAAELIESLTSENPGFVSHVVLVELAWVLGRCYTTERAAIAQFLEQLIRTKEIIIEAADVAWRAVRAYRDGTGDFPDLLIERIAAAAGCEHTATFDSGAAKKAGMRLIG